MLASNVSIYIRIEICEMVFGDFFFLHILYFILSSKVVATGSQGTLLFDSLIPQ